MFQTITSFIRQKNFLSLDDLDSTGVKKYFQNTGWLFLARGTTFVTSFFTMALVARYLGPENLGKLSYAQSFVSIFSIFASLGIDQILFRDLAAHPEKEKELLGTAVYSKLFFGFLAFTAACLTSFGIGNEPLLTLLVGITAFTFLINPLGTISILFQARVQAKYASQVTLFLAFFIPLLKILTVFFDKGIIYFSLILLVEALMSTVWSVYIYMSRFKSSPLHWYFSMPMFKQLLSDSWPFIFAGFFAYLYARIDQVMLQSYFGSASVGLYDIAVRLTNMWSFIPALIITSLFPAIVKAKQSDHDTYLKRFGSLIMLIILITLLITIIVFLIAKPLVLGIFGEQYMASIAVLRIYIWAGVLAILGLLVQQYLIAENNGGLHLVLTALGACVNIALNSYMIPHYGITGAAASTLFSFAVIPVGILFVRQHRKNILKMFLK